MNTPMTPTIGRIVHFYDGEGEVPSAAIITAVHGDDCVNLSIFTGVRGEEVRCISSVTMRRATNERGWEWPPRV